MRTNIGTTKSLMTMALVVILSGCSSTEWTDGGQNASNAIRLSVTAGKQTRAMVVDNSNITASPFGLYAYHHSQLWDDFLAAGIGKPNFMNDQTLTYDATNDEWTYTPLKFWSSDNVSFFAYSPQTASIASPKTIVSGQMPTIHFMQDMDVARMTDFVVANAVNKTKDQGTVKLTFKHALTRLNFSARLDRDLSDDAATKAFVTGLSIMGGGDATYPSNRLYGSADYTFTADATASGWEYATAQQEMGDVNVQNIMELSAQAFGTYTSTSVPVAQDGTATKLLKENEYLFLVPPRGKDGIQENTDLRVKVDYEIVTNDNSIEDGNVTSPNSAIISLPNGKLQEGKAYNVIFTFALNEVKLSVEVADWEDGDIHAPSQDATGNTETEILLAWQTLNETKKVNLNATYFVIHVPTTPAGDLDLSAATGIEAFADDDQVELVFDDGGTFAGKIATPAGWTYITRTVAGETHYIIVKAVPKANMPVGGLSVGTSGEFTDGGTFDVSN